MDEEIKNRFYKAITPLPPRQQKKETEPKRPGLNVPEQLNVPPMPPARTCTNHEKMHEDLKNIYKELHAIAQELEKINRTLNKRK